MKILVESIYIKTFTPLSFGTDFTYSFGIRTSNTVAGIKLQSRVFLKKKKFNY